ncbi:MAG: hypothetical protein R6W95_18440, partial [Desulfosarcina sp.]
TIQFLNFPSQAKPATSATSPQAIVAGSPSVCTARLQPERGHAAQALDDGRHVPVLAAGAQCILTGCRPRSLAAMWPRLPAWPVGEI